MWGFSRKFTEPIQNTLWQALCAFLALSIFACSPAQKTVRPTESGDKQELPLRIDRVEISPLNILAAKDKELGLEAYDDRILLEKGEEYLSDADFAFAVKFFARLLMEYPNSERAPKASYNLGLALARIGDCQKSVFHLGEFLEKYPDNIYRQKALTLRGACLNKLGMYREAIPHFAEALSINPETSDAIDALFYKGEALFELKMYSEAQAQFERLVNDYTLFPHAVVETITRIARCEIEKGEYERAESLLYGAITYFKEIQKQEYIDPRVGAEAQYYMGEIYKLKYGAVKLEFPQELMAERLEEKAELLLKAQMHFLKAIRYGDVQWAAASGYSIGELYEEFYHSIMNAPVPAELNAEEGDYYLKLLRKRVRVLVKKAIHAYETTLGMAYRVGLQGKWVELTNERMNKMKEIYLDAPEVEEYFEEPETKEEVSEGASGGDKEE